MNNKKKIILLQEIFILDELQSPSKLIHLPKPLSSRFSLKISDFGSRACRNGYIHRATGLERPVNLSLIPNKR